MNRCCTAFLTACSGGKLTAFLSTRETLVTKIYTSLTIAAASSSFIAPCLVHVHQEATFDTSSSLSMLWRSLCLPPCSSTAETTNHLAVLEHLLHCYVVIPTVPSLSITNLHTCPLTVILRLATSSTTQTILQEVPIVAQVCTHFAISYATTTGSEKVSCCLMLWTEMGSIPKGENHRQRGQNHT